MMEDAWEKTEDIYVKKVPILLHILRITLKMNGGGSIEHLIYFIANTNGTISYNVPLKINHRSGP